MNCCTYRVKQFCVTVLIATGHLNRNDKLWPLHTLLTVCWVFFIYRIGRRHQNKNLRASVITCAEDCVLYAIILTPWRHFFHTTSHVPFAYSPTACGLHVVDLLPTVFILTTIFLVNMGCQVSQSALFLSLLLTRNFGGIIGTASFACWAPVFTQPTGTNHWKLCMVVWLLAFSDSF